MRRDDAILGDGFELGGAGPRRSRVGAPRSRRWTRGRIALLLAAVGLPLLPGVGAPPGDPPMRRARGKAGAPVQSLAFSPDGQIVAATDDRGGVRLRPVVAGRGIERDFEFTSFVGAASFSPDGRYLAVGRYHADVSLCDLVQGGPGRRLGIPAGVTNALRFSPDGRTLAIWNHRIREIILWDLEAGRRRTTLPGHDTPIIGLAFADDGRSLASMAVLDPVVRVWDLASRRPRRVLTEPSVITKAFSPDGRLLATARGDLTIVRVWDVRSGGQVRSIAGLPALARSVAFSPDGQLLATSSGDRFVCLWSIATGLGVRRLDAESDIIRLVAFSPDGRTLAAAGNDGDIRLWELDGLIHEVADADRCSGGRGSVGAPRRDRPGPRLARPDRIPSPGPCRRDGESLDSH